MERPEDFADEERGQVELEDLDLDDDAESVKGGGQSQGDGG